jgi:hypothetical protein
MNKLFIGLLILVVACNPKPPEPSKPVNAVGVTSGIGEWKVDPPTAVAMINSAKGKACNPFTITNQNAPLKALIDSTYPADKFTYSQVDARYLPNADEAKYRRLRGLPPGSPKGNIRGFCTKLFVVKSISNQEGSEEYFDIYTVCPPPPDCNGDSLDTGN